MKTLKFLAIMLMAVSMSACSSTEKKIGVAAIVVGGIAAISNANDNSSNRGANAYDKELNSIHVRRYCNDTYGGHKFLRDARNRCNERVRAFNDFKKNYNKLSAYRAKNFAKLQSVVNQRVALEMKAETEGLTQRESNKLFKLLQQEAELDQQGAMYDSKVIRYQDALQQAQRRYNANGGSFDLEILVRYERARASRY